MEAFRKLVESLSRAMAVVSITLLAAMVSLITVNVILRPSPQGGILGTYELTGYLGAGLVAMALGYVQLTRANIQVDFLVSRLSRKTQAVVDSITCFVSAFLYGIIAFCCFKEGISMWKHGEVSLTLSIPLLPVYFIIGLGCGLLGVVLLADSIKSINDVVR